MSAPARVAVVGTSGSGKTTFAGALAARLGHRHVELDALHWDANWTMAELDVFRARVDAVTSRDAWVVDGSYSKVRDLIWPRADTLVWLDYPLLLTLARLFRRTATRVWTGARLWNDNHERLRDHLGRDSLFLWAIQQHRRNRSRYPEALADPAHSHLRLVRFHSPAEAAGWLGSLGSSRGAGDSNA